MQYLTWCQSQESISKYVIPTRASEYDQEMPQLQITVQSKAKIRNRYNQVPHLTRDTAWKLTKYTNQPNSQESQKVSHFPAGDHKAARKTQDGITKTYLFDMQKW